jgi:hypothetical protein
VSDSVTLTGAIGRGVLEEVDRLAWEVREQELLSLSAVRSLRRAEGHY